MFRFIIKLPKNHIIRKNGQINFKVLPIQLRHFATPQLCPPPKPPKKQPSSGTGYTIGAITLIGLGTIGYAKYDPEFRNWLGDNVPYANGFFSFIFQEEQSAFTALTDWIGCTASAIFTSMLPVKPKRDLTPDHEKREYIPPRAVFPALIKEEKEQKYSEIRVQKDETKPIEAVKEKPKKEDDAFLPTHPKNMAELELQLRNSAKDAINSYKKALTALREYNYEVENIVDNSVEKLDKDIWNTLKKKTETKNKYIESADKSAEDAIKKIHQLERLLKDKDLFVSDETKATACRNLERYLADIEVTKKMLDDERKMANITEKYWGKVQTARCHFIEELQILFPNFDISKKKISLNQADFDLFILHAFANVLFYQKELHKVEILGNNKLKHALEQVKKGDKNFDVVEIHIQEEIEKEKRNLANDYRKKCLELRKESERDLRHRLKCQAEAHQDHLADALTTREQELEREFNRKLDAEIANEQLQYKMQLAGMVGRMKGMRNAIKERVEADKIAQKSQVLWSACQALHRAVRSSTPGIPWKDQIKPLQREILAIRKAASDGDELVKVVLDGIPEEALIRGVFPEDAIRERFLKVERVARRVALLPKEGGRLPLFMLSFLQSMLLVPATNPIPQSELADEKTDFSKLDTYDILQRARYWLDRGNYAQTLRYMNLLKGAARCIATEWMNETRILLETQQAAETLMAHAVAGGLTHI